MVSSIFLTIAFLITLFLCSRHLSKYYNHEISSRNVLLDAFRGLLAPLVFLHHFLLTFHWKTSGQWGVPDNKIVSNLGSIPVSFFFMITGYLFIKKITTKNIIWHELLSNRILRVYPLYLFVLAISYLTYFLTSPKNIINLELTKSIHEGLTFILKPVGGFNIGRVLGGAQWTLVYEALFYLSLPIIYILLKRKISFSLIIFSTPLFFAFDYYYTNTYVINKLFFFFFTGATCFYLSEVKKINFLKSKMSALVSLTLLSVALLKTESYSNTQHLAVGLLFLCVCSKNNLLGLLNSKGLSFYGDISYSIYLTHGIILYYTFSVFNLQDHLPNYNHSFYLVLPPMLILVTITSCCTYYLIEKPFMKIVIKRKKL